MNMQTNHHQYKPSLTTGSRVWSMILDCSDRWLDELTLTYAATCLCVDHFLFPVSFWAGKENTLLWSPALDLFLQAFHQCVLTIVIVIVSIKWSYQSGVLYWSPWPGSAMDSARGFLNKLNTFKFINMFSIMLKIKLAYGSCLHYTLNTAHFTKGSYHLAQ